MTHNIHRISSIIAFICIVSFFISTLFVEIFASNESIALVKSLIIMPGLFILIPSMAITGATGFALAKTNTNILVKKKKKRMPFIVILGVLILIPAAITLNIWASAGIFDTKFYILQIIELIAGFINLTLIGLSMKDGYNITKFSIIKTK